MSSSKLNDLRQILADTSLPMAARRDAAEHYVIAMLEAVPIPADDDPDVAKLTKGWDDKKLAELMAQATNGRSLTGHCVADAIDSVLRQRKRKVLEQLHADDDAALVRDVAGIMIGKTSTVRRSN